MRSRRFFVEMRGNLAESRCFVTSDVYKLHPDEILSYYSQTEQSY